MERQSATVQPLLVGMAIGLIAGVIVVDLVVPIGVVAGALYVSLAMISLLSKRRAFPLLIAAACTGLIGYEFYTMSANEESVTWMTVAGRALALFAIWDTAILSILHQQAEGEVKRLQQLLSICPSCKMVRDGKGKWQEVEEFVKTQGRESYPGLCPECRKSWAPGEVLLRPL